MQIKTSLGTLAVFGGSPLFSKPLSIGQLATPEVEDFLALMKQAFDERRLANDGPLVCQLEKELAAYHRVTHCIAVANAGLGIMMLIQLFGAGKAGEVIMPAFSFRGLPHFAQWAGQMPRFCDVDPIRHTLSPEAVEAAITKHTTSILAVCNFNSPGDIDGLCQVAERHRVPIFFDSVYAMGATYRGQPLGGHGQAEVYSLHATKLLNGFEGGYITTNDDDLADMLRWQRNFSVSALQPPGFTDQWNVLGLNAKLNEAHAGLALLNLRRLDDVIAANRARHEAYSRVIEGCPGLSLVPYENAESEARNYQMAVLSIEPPWPLTRDQMVALLRAEGAGVNAYYSPPLHRSEHAPAGISNQPLPVTERLASRHMTLPVGSAVSADEVAVLGHLFDFLGRNGKEVARRLSEGAIT